MKTKLHALLSGLAMGLCAHAAFAGTATGVGGGGNTIDVNGRPSLRDLVDTTLCSWISGDDLAARMGYLPKIYVSLDRFDTLYADLIRQEVSRVAFCLTDGDLLQVKTEDQDGLTIFTNDTRQVAIRLNNIVYIDRKILSAMDDRNQAYLLVHEIMHAFVPVVVNPQNGLFLSLDPQMTDEYGRPRDGISLPQRNMRLRSFIKTLSDNELRPMSLNEFLLQVRMNYILWPSTRADLDTLNANRAMIQAATNPSTSAGSHVVKSWKLQSQPDRARHWLAAAEPRRLQQMDDEWHAFSPEIMPENDCNRLSESNLRYVLSECFDPTGHQSTRYLHTGRDFRWIIGQLSKRLGASDWKEVLQDEQFMNAISDTNIRNVYYFAHPIVGQAQSDELDGKLTDRQLENMRIYLEIAPVEFLLQCVILPRETAPRTLAVIRTVFQARGLKAPKPPK